MVRKGLTVVEYCTVLAIIVMIAAVVFVVIDPAAKKVAARNAQRWTDVTALMEGVQTAFTQTEGELTDDLEKIDTDAQTVQMIVDGNETVVCGTICGTEHVAGENCSVDLTGLVAKGFVAAVPHDPSVRDNGSGYYVNYNDGVFTVGACSAEEEKNGATPTVRISR
jgi:hypothetical protein